MIKKETYEKLKPFETYLSSAYYANYFRQLRRNDQMELRVIYREIFGIEYTDSPNCNACILTLLKKIGKEYFSYKPVEPIKATVEDTVEATVEDTIEEVVDEVVKTPKVVDEVKPVTTSKSTTKRK